MMIFSTALTMVSQGQCQRLVHRLPGVIGLLLVLIIPEVCFSQISPGNTGANDDSLRIARRQVQILNADEVIGSENRRVLSGNVFLRQENTYIKADRVVQTPGSGDLQLDGRVWIAQDSDTLLAKSVVYNRYSKIAFATGPLTLSNGEVTIAAPTARYFADEKRISFEDGAILEDSTSTLRSEIGTYWTEEERGEFEINVQLQDSTTLLTSDKGKYWTDEKRAVFYENVVLESDDLYLEADSVIHFRETEETFAIRHVYAKNVSPADSVDAESVLVLFGDLLYHDGKTNRTTVSEKALAISLPSTAASDTLWVSANQLLIAETDSLRSITADFDVKVLKGSVSAKADSMLYHEKNNSESESKSGELRFFGTPVLWKAASQISGDTLLVRTLNEKIDSLFVTGNAMVIQWDSTLSLDQQLTSRRLKAGFRGDSLQTMLFLGRAQMLYFSAADSSADKAMKTASEQIVIGFANENIDSFSAAGGVDGTVYDMAEPPPNLELSGYRREVGPTRRDDVFVLDAIRSGRLKKAGND